MYISIDSDLVVRSVSDMISVTPGQSCRKSDNKYDWESLLGKRIPKSMLLQSDFKSKLPNQLRVAFVCNWNSQCGISTYSKYLVDSMKNKVSAIKIFSENIENKIETQESNLDVEYCWRRGESLISLADRILEWSPDFIIVQHEFGIFPNAFRYMQFVQHLRKIPTVTTMHSVYNHVDKLVYTEGIPNIIVHTKEAKKSLKEQGNSSKIFVIPHGCVQSNETSELWNIMQNPYTVMQFGFGFRYKGVDRALKAVSHLVHNDPKFKNLYYFYLCSSNDHNQILNQEYCDYLANLASELGIKENVAIVMKYQSDKMLDLYLRLAKIVIFPYIMGEDNTVYGSSGAARLAMAAKRPVITSESHLFDDLEGIVPRPKDHLELAKEIDEIFSNSIYKKSIIGRCSHFIANNSWDDAADKYLALYNEVIDH